MILAASVTHAIAQDIPAGEAAFRKCQICHDVGEAAKNKLGPELNGLDGRKAGTAKAQSSSHRKYSQRPGWDYYECRGRGPFLVTGIAHNCSSLPASLIPIFLPCGGDTAWLVIPRAAETTGMDAARRQTRQVHSVELTAEPSLEEQVSIPSQSSTSRCARRC